MTRRLRFISLALLGGAWVAGCNTFDDDLEKLIPDGGAGVAGTAGTSGGTEGSAGTDGTGGDGGTSGEGGTSGTGGTNDGGGTGGTSGTSGTGGTGPILGSDLCENATELVVNADNTPFP